MRTWDTQGSSRRALALLVVVVVSGVLLLPAGWHPLRPASAQTSDNPPPDEPKDGEVSEFLEAAKLGALASGNVIAGPGQVIIPAGDIAAGENLWLNHGERQNVTLTVQLLGGCDNDLRFLVENPVETRSMHIGPGHVSSAISQSSAFQITYGTFKTIPSDCLFLWVLRETSDSDPRGR